MGIIRFLLACAVVLCHTSAIFGYMPLTSDLAVQVFYIISGFYMAMILNEKYIGRKANYLFYTNRALKIYPVYWVTLIMLLAWALFVHKLGYPSTFDFYANSWPLSFATLLFLAVANIFILGLDWVFLFGLKDGSLYFTSNFNQAKPNVYNFAFNSIAWTVGVELVFYLIAPYIVRRNVFIVAGILLASLLLRVILAMNGLSFPPWNYMFFPTQLMFFMGGVISYHLYLKLKQVKVNKSVLGLSYLGLISIILFYYQVFEESYLKQGIMFLCVILFIPASFIVTKNNKIDKFLGNLSYPVYISQFFIIRITQAKAFPKLFGWVLPRLYSSLH